MMHKSNYSHDDPYEVVKASDLNLVTFECLPWYLGTSTASVKEIPLVILDEVYTLISTVIKDSVDAGDVEETKKLLDLIIHDIRAEMFLKCTT